MAYRITESDEPNRLRVEFDEPEFGAAAMHGVNRVGGRRDDAGRTTHYVFPPECRDDVIAAVNRTVARNDAQRKWVAAAPQRALEAAASAKAAKAAEIALADAQVHAEIRECGEHGFSLHMGYVMGAPAKLRKAGASWDTLDRCWVFPASKRASIEKLLPALKLLAVKQVGRGYEGMSDDDLEGMAQDGVLGNDINASARDLRRDLRNGRI